MPDLTDEPAAPTAADAVAADAAPTKASPAASNRRDQQRAALDQLIYLAGECAAIDRRLEAERQKAEAAARDVYLQAEGRLDVRYKNARHAAEQKRAQAVDQLESAAAGRTADLDQEESETRKRLAEKRKKIERTVQKKIQDAAWLADGVLDAEQNRARSDFDKRRKLDEKRLETLQDKTDDAAETAARLGGSLPEIPTDPRHGLTPDDLAQEDALDPHLDAVDEALAKLKGLFLPKLVVGAAPWVLLTVIVILVALAAHVWSVGQGFDLPALTQTVPDWPIVGGAAGGAAVLLVIVGVLLKKRAAAQVADAARDVADRVGTADAAVQADLAAAAERRDARLAEVQADYDSEMAAERAKYEPHAEKARRDFDQQAAALDADLNGRRSASDQKRQTQLDAAESAASSELKAIEEDHAAKLAPAAKQRDAASAEAERIYKDGRTALERRWSEALKLTQEMATDSDRPRVRRRRRLAAVAAE